ARQVESTLFPYTTLFRSPGNSTENLARLLAQKGNQEMDVVILDDGPMYQAEALGFCDSLGELPSLPDIYDIARMGSDKAIGVGRSEEHTSELQSRENLVC